MWFKATLLPLFFQEKEGVTDELKSSVDFWFGSLGKTLYTLLLSILGGVSWHLVCSELRWAAPLGFEDTLTKT
jgi:hypothetical protein